jgi:hypothetical protein
MGRFLLEGFCGLFSLRRDPGGAPNPPPDARGEGVSTVQNVQ